MIRKFQAVGYEVGHTLFGAPFDFRKPIPTIVEGSFGQAFFKLVDEAYTKTGKPMHIVTHSYGGPTVLYWMQNYKPHGMTPSEFKAWVQQRVKSFVPIGGPWSGAAKPLRGVLSGDRFGAPEFLINVDTVTKTTRTFGGMVNLFPDPAYWPSNYTFVTTPQRSYTASEADISQLLQDVGAEDARVMYRHVNRTIDTLKKPEVKTYCLYGFDKPTGESI